MSFLLPKWNYRISTTLQGHTEKFFSIQTKLKFQLLLRFSKITLSGSIVPLINSCFQNCNACSKVRPMPLRKRPYCMRPPWRRWWFSRRALCNWRMQGGKDLVESYRKKNTLLFINPHNICYKINRICKLQIQFNWNKNKNHKKVIIVSQWLQMNCFSY